MSPWLLAFRHPRLYTPKSPMLRLLLARHGETEWNVSRRYQGWGDSPLTPTGHGQARLLARRLAAEPIDVVYASDCQRAWQTAEIAVAGRDLVVHRDPAWRELSYGEWEGQTAQQVKERWPDLFAQRGADSENVAPPGGETRLQLRDRLLAAVERLQREHSGQRILVVSHSGAVGLLGSWFHTGAVAQRSDYAPVNCSLSAIGWLQDSHAIEFWNDGAHLVEQPEN